MRIKTKIISAILITAGSIMISAAMMPAISTSVSDTHIREAARQDISIKETIHAESKSVEGKEKLKKEGEMPVPDMDVLKKINSDIVGWVRIPDTIINYPLLISPDDFYLTHSVNKDVNVHGSIYTRNMSDTGMYIYGHNMRDGSMFASLHKYRVEGYRKNHDSLFIYTDRWRRYEFDDISICGSDSVESATEDCIYTVTCAGKNQRLVIRWVYNERHQ